MVLDDEHGDVLLQGMSGSPIDDMWYLDTRASNHMTSMKTFYQSLDESHIGVVSSVMVLQLGLKAKVKYMWIAQMTNG